MTARTFRRVLAAALATSALAGTALFALVGGAPASAAPLDPKIKPDAVVEVGKKVTIKNDEVLVNALALSGGPDSCRGNPSAATEAAASQACRAYRVKLNLDPDPLAVNTVFFRLDFEQTQLPGLPLVAAGLNPPPVNGYDVQVYDQADHYLGQNAPDPTLDPITGPGDPEDLPPGGATFASPEIGSFIAKTDTYDFVVSSQIGVSRGFVLTIELSNLLFQTPREILDALGAPPAPVSPPTGAETAPPFAGGAGPGVAPLPLADVLADDDIAGIGLGTTEQFDQAEALRLGQQALRNISVDADPPSALTLVLAMVLLPLAVAGVAVLLLRRRHALIV